MEVGHIIFESNGLERVKFVLMAPMLVEVAMKAFHAAHNADVR
ncbi:hypothetical protein T01_486 [Trichinella spiralis]|uniref:Uncharacterized protein n=1 Tax=Trichinella spiralis TaxID=6334 RepID=A0A0V1AJI8_TRISP|nr:hypothetical protein T01_486 [Trichinella spiralis]